MKGAHNRSLGITSISKRNTDAFSFQFESADQQPLSLKLATTIIKNENGFELQSGFWVGSTKRVKRETFQPFIKTPLIFQNDTNADVFQLGDAINISRYKKKRFNIDIQPSTQKQYYVFGSFTKDSPAVK